jgi:hypothetical protein
VAKQQETDTARLRVDMSKHQSQLAHQQRQQAQQRMQQQQQPKSTKETK